MGSKEQPERKRRHANNAVSSPRMQVDTAELQYQNHKLAQQLDSQKNEIHALETKFHELKQKQLSYDESLASIQDAWEEFMDNLELLCMRVSAPIEKFAILESSPSPKGVINSSLPPEDIFLHRLLYTGAVENSGVSNGDLSMERVLEQRNTLAMRIVEQLVHTIDAHRAKNEDLYSSLKQGLPFEEYEQQLKGYIEDMRLEVEALRSAIESMQSKHNELVLEISSYEDIHAKDQAELKRLKGDLEETLADLETSRRKLAAMRFQKDGTTPISGSGSGVQENIGKESDELETALNEAKNTAAKRLEVLEKLQKEKMTIMEEVLCVQDSLTNDNHVMTSSPYVELLNEDLRLKKELEGYQLLVEEAQMERDKSLQFEKESVIKSEAGDMALKISTILRARILELESSLEQYLLEIEELQGKLDKATLSSDKKDEFADFKITVSSIHKEMRMMQQQLNQYKEAACGAYALSAEVESLNAILERKTVECKKLSDKVAEKAVEIDAIREEVRLLRESESELKLILDMYGRESMDTKEVQELKQAECRAWAQLERLRSAMDEQSLEMRVKAAIESEAACQQRLGTVEAEIAELMQRIDASSREAVEANDILAMKSEEGDAYLAEIETIGQAYEDMQTQNQRLLQQISERDDYNLKLIFEGFKTKQLQSSLAEEKQGLISQLQYATLLAECYKSRTSWLEDQLRIHSEQLGKTLEDTQQQSNTVEEAKRKLSEAEDELSSAKSTLNAAQKELEHQRSKLIDVQAELDMERFERKRVHEELVILSNKTARLHAQNDAGSLAERLQEEIKEYRAILKCSVCQERPKEVVITKCFHLFCSPCVQKSLETRQRKCPSCGTVFGQNDVRNVYI